MIEYGLNIRAIKVSANNKSTVLVLGFGQGGRVEKVISDVTVICSRWGRRMVNNSQNNAREPSWKAFGSKEDP